MSSSAICFSSPKSIDLHRTKLLQQTLTQLGLFETNEESKHRSAVLSKLDKLFKNWIISISKEKNTSLVTFGGKVCAFGSYRLGVHTKNSDIDALCVAPVHVDRSDFFKSFYELQSEIIQL
uniref:Poly(A) polymerase nucleotidyltransferase domain-containing protein n=1 Tax=Strigamia maritima TaxID=126957 RepID=T1IHY6_STRMM